MSRICVIVPGMPADEDEWFLPYLVEYLRRLQERADIHVYALKHPGKIDSYTIHGIPVTSFRKRWIRLQTSVMNAVLTQHQKEPFTHVHAVWANTAGFFGAMVARNLKLPFVVTMAGEELVNLPAIEYGAMRRWRTQPILRYVFAAADAIVAPSPGTQAKLMHQWRIPENKIHSIAFGVDTELFHPVTQPSGPLHVVAVGGLIPVKRHSLLLKAFAIVREAVPDARLTIVGEGPLRGKLESLTEELRLHDTVAFPGWLDHADMPYFYRTAHIAAVTSYHEEIPVSLLEALASGLHAVAVNTGVAYDLAERGLFPVTISEPDADSFAGHIIAAWEEYGTSAPLSPEAVRHLSVDNTVDVMRDVFQATAR